MTEIIEVIVVAFLIIAISGLSLLSFYAGYKYGKREEKDG